MGIEVGDVDGAAAAMGEVDSVEALVGACETLDLGDRGTEIAGEVRSIEEVDSNGCLMEDEDAAAASIEAVSEVGSRAGDVSETSRSPMKDWSDFNAVCAKTFGDQTLGSFSDLLAPQPDAPTLQPSGASLDLAGSDLDFFEWGAMGSEPEVPALAGVEAALPGSDPSQNAATIMSHGEELGISPTALPAQNDFSGEQQVATWLDPPVDEGPTLVADAVAEAGSQSVAVSYPGWYWDYDVGQWREVEGYSAPIASGSANHAEAQQVQTVAEISTSFPTPVVQAAGVAAPGEVGLEQSQSWDSHSAATQTVADEYPGWKWDYAAQTWVAVPGYNESSSWQTSSEAQSPALSGQESWYGHQEQQTQQQPYKTDSTNVLSQNENPVASYQQQPPNFFPEYASGSANVTANGYASQMANSVNTGSVYSQDTKQWQGETGGASNFYFPHTNGEQGWPAASGFNKQEQFASQSMVSDAYPSSDAYYNYPANGGSNNSYSQENQQQNQQQPWGNASHFNQYQQQQQQYTNPTAPPPKNVHEAMRTCSGRPPHSLAAFGFGGKFIFMKHRDPVTLHTSNGDQAFASGEAWMPGPIQVSNLKTHLPQEQTFAGPLMGGGSIKELNKWIDERVATQSPYDSSRLLLGVLKVACQHYGNLRSSSVNAGNPAVEDGPEAALAKLLAGAGGEQGPFAGLASRNPPLRGVPLEQQLQGTALEVKKFLVCGKRKDALKCAQEGELWGIALLIARQLGEKFFCDTVTEMARRQFVSGSPLRTLSLLLAGQPAEVFAAPSLQSGNPMGGVPVASDQSQDGQGAMLDDWQENIAIMAANRTQGDERVMLHLGDRLWSVRGEVAAAHLCYLVADANLESYSGNARLCLIGADHCKNPRTFVTPEAIQRTEIYEYAKLLGNPQSILLSFQPYKLVYAEMLVECGNTRDSLKYCQTVLKTLKSAGMRSPEVEACRILATSLEERLRVHMQDGYGSNLAPRKLVNKIKGTMDWGISKLIGGPPTAPAADSFGYRPLDNGDHFGGQTSRPGSSAGQRSGALPPSASIAASMERLPQGLNRGPARSQSEPDFGRNAKQGETEGVSPRAAGSRLAGLGRLSSNILQRATGLWGSNKKEAKLGDANKFYYDEKLKKWVEEGVDPTPDVAPPPPPPTTSSFMGSVPSQEETNAPPQAVTSKPGTPPLAPNSNNYYSNRRQSGGVRSRYVDTFNKGGSVSPAKSVMGSLLPPSMPGGGMMSTPSMFVPAPVALTSFSENNSDVADNFVGGSSRTDDASSSQGPLSDTANSNGNTDNTGLGYPPSTYSMIPPASTADSGLASFKSQSTDFSSFGAPPVFGGAHTKSSSWGGYPSSFQNPLISGEEDGFGASFSGHDRLTDSEHAPSMSVAQSAYTNFYLPNGTGANASLPPPPPLGVPTTAGEGRDSNRQFMGQQQLKVSQSVDSLTGEEMQEVEL